MKENNERLQKIVFENLMSLPAYRLRGKNREIFKKYAYTELNKSAQKEAIQENYDNNGKQSISEIYQKPNQLKMFLFSFKSLPEKYKRLGLAAVVLLPFAFLVRNSNIVLVLLGLFSLLSFELLLLAYGTHFSTWYSYTKSTFSIINRLIDESKIYLEDFKIVEINEDNLHSQAYSIIGDLIKDEISGLDYDWKKTNVFNILFAFVLSLMFTYISGDFLVDIISWTANILGLGNLRLIKQLNTEQLSTLILFPLGIALSKDIFISSLKERNRLLRRSYRIVEKRYEQSKYGHRYSLDLIAKSQNTLKKLLLEIPEIGEDSDFKRISDKGRDISL